MSGSQKKSGKRMVKKQYLKMVENFLEIMKETNPEVFNTIKSEEKGGGKSYIWSSYVNVLRKLRPK